VEEKVYQLGMNTGKSCPFCNKNMDVIEIRGEKDFIRYTMVCNCKKVKIEFYDYDKNYNDIKESVKMKNKVIFENEEEAIKQFELCIGYDYKDKKQILKN